MIDPERLFRRVWLINGVLLLVCIIGIGGFLAYETAVGFGEDREGGVDARTRQAGTAPQDTLPRAVRYSAPERIVGTETRLIEIDYGAGYTRPERGAGLGGGFASSYTERPGGATVNLLFLPPEGSARLLLDKPAYISEVTYPSKDRDWRDEQVDTVPWITYSIAFTDTNGDGKLDRSDTQELYISDLDGAHFRRVLPESLRFREARSTGGGRLLVLAIDGRGRPGATDEELPERAFTFTPRTGELVAETALDSLVSMAGRVVGQSVSGDR